MTKRYEYKYVVDGWPLAKILQIIRTHPAGFSEAYPQRKVNNFYLDTLQLDFFYQNIDGVADRKKFRYRWYGDITVTQTAQLEIKNKANELGWKNTIMLDPKHIQSKALLEAHFQALELTSAALTPILYNAYKRYYFESADGTFRITVDYAQEFGRPFHMGAAYRVEQKEPSVVVELKFDEVYSPRLDEITHYLPLLRTKNSKYSNGVTTIYF